jgi:ribosome biogenesis protein Tsr3
MMAFLAVTPIQVLLNYFHVLHMDPMGDVSKCYKLLVAHLCQCPCLVLDCSWEKTVSVLCAAKTERKLMVFLVTKPIQMLLNLFISSIWIH